MNSFTKVLIPNKEWLIQLGDEKIGTLEKSKLGYTFWKHGEKFSVKDISQINHLFGINISLPALSIEKIDNAKFSIYDFPCKSKPFKPVYNVKKRLPLFTKSDKSNSQYCAGYYVIQFRTGWVKSFCPKLITVERNNFQGPYKTENEVKQILNNLNKQ